MAKEILFTGRLTRERLEELAHTHLDEFQPIYKQEIRQAEKLQNPPEPDTWNPLKNKDIIAIERLKDGSYRAHGYFQQQNKTCRSTSPEMALQGLITGMGEVV